MRELTLISSAIKSNPKHEPSVYMTIPVSLSSISKTGPLESGTPIDTMNVTSRSHAIHLVSSFSMQIKVPYDSIWMVELQYRNSAKKSDCTIITMKIAHFPEIVVIRHNVILLTECSMVGPSKRMDMNTLRHWQYRKPYMNRHLRMPL